jgi:antitoxin ParD1/3/4
MATRNVKLTEHYERFVDKKVREGRFQDASEVVRAGLHLLEQQDRAEHEKLELLRKLAAQGFAEIDQGLGIAIESKQELRDVVRAAGKRASGKISKRRT